MPTNPLPPLLEDDTIIQWYKRVFDKYADVHHLAFIREICDGYERERATAATRIATLEAKLRIAETALGEYMDEAAASDEIIRMYEKG